MKLNTLVVTARFPGRNPAEMVAQLKEVKVMVSCREDTIRFSPHLYNREGDILRAVACMEKVL